MRKIVFLLIVAFGIPVVVAVYVIHILKTDTPLYWARELYPLGKKQSYILQLNGEVRGSENEIVLKEGSFYTFVLPEEKQQQPLSSGRLVGGFDIDLKPYLNREVYIDGYFYEGIPFRLQEISMPELFEGRQVVLMYIRSVTIVW